MMNKVLLTLAASTAALLVSVPALADPTIVNLAAVDPTNATATPTPVTQTFGPGTYNVSVVGKAGGGAYDAWSVATPAAGNWNDAFALAYGSVFTNVNPYAGQRFATAADALAAFSGVLTSFTLATTTAVTFGIPDTFYFDNTGGVSLGITQASPASVPEPATIGLFGLGMLGLLAMTRRRQKNALSY